MGEEKITKKEQNTLNFLFRVYNDGKPIATLTYLVKEYGMPLCTGTILKKNGLLREANAGMEGRKRKLWKWGSDIKPNIYTARKLLKETKAYNSKASKKSYSKRKAVKVNGLKPVCIIKEEIQGVTKKDLVTNTQIQAEVARRVIAESIVRKGSTFQGTTEQFVEDAPKPKKSWWRRLFK